tara:strand:+ start:1412 stop:2857 length:1446 start_codon:yes stop_codon:yes gene_type:complete
MKNLYKLITILLLVPLISVSAQSNRKIDKTDSRTRNWQYESTCFGAGGVGSSYLLKVTSYVADMRLALPQAKKNAIHSVLFKGVVGNNSGCTSKDALIPSGTYSDNFEYFEDFFYNTSSYNKFSTAPSGSAEDSNKLGRKNYRVTFLISVNVDELRKKLEFDKIIIPLGLAEGVQGTKPSIMIFPDKVWMKENKYFKMVDNQGRMVFVPDYDAAILDPKLKIAIQTLDGMVGKRGYPTVRLAETINSIDQGSALDNATEGRDGGASETSITEEILNVAKADIIWNVNWTFESNSIQNWIDYGIEALDAYTNKSLPGASISGSGPKSMSASEGDLIRQAVTDKMDAFLVGHQTYFDNLVKNGREISLDIRRFDSFEYYFNDDVEFKGKEMELSSLIRGFLGSIAKDRNFSFNANENTINVTDLRIEMSKEEEDMFGGGAVQVPQDASMFAKQLQRFIKKEFDVPSKVLTIGLGKARITIGEK